MKVKSNQINWVDAPLFAIETCWAHERFPRGGSCKSEYFFIGSLLAVYFCTVLQAKGVQDKKLPQMWIDRHVQIVCLVFFSLWRSTRESRIGGQKRESLHQNIHKFWKACDACAHRKKYQKLICQKKQHHPNFLPLSDKRVHVQHSNLSATNKITGTLFKGG